MCNCDQGAYCTGGKEDAAESPEIISHIQDREMGKTCKAVTAVQCGNTTGVNSCMKCGTKSTYDCEQCCPGCEQTTRGDYTYCACGKTPGKPGTKGSPFAAYASESPLLALGPTDHPIH
jgi:hypothetical protein